MEYRRATADDARDLAVIHIRSWQEAYPGQIAQGHLDGLTDQLDDREVQWRERLTAEPAPRVWIAVEAGHPEPVAGFVVVGPPEDAETDPSTGQLLAIYARRRAWGSGVGHRLWGLAMGELAEIGCEHATLWVLDTNERARRFYERQGWSADGGTTTDEYGGAIVTEVRYRGRCQPSRPVRGG